MCPSRVRTNLPVESKIRTILSAPPEAIQRPSGEKRASTQSGYMYFSQIMYDRPGVGCQNLRCHRSGLVDRYPQQSRSIRGEVERGQSLKGLSVAVPIVPFQYPGNWNNCNSDLNRSQRKLANFSYPNTIPKEHLATASIGDDKLTMASGLGDWKRTRRSVLSELTLMILLPS